jgi:hypothetical protein
MQHEVVPGVRACPELEQQRAQLAMRGGLCEPPSRRPRRRCWWRARGLWCAHRRAGRRRGSAERSEAAAHGEVRVCRCFLTLVPAPRPCPVPSTTLRALHLHLHHALLSMHLTNPTRRLQTHALSTTIRGRPGARSSLASPPALPMRLRHHTHPRCPLQYIHILRSPPTA